MLRFAAVLLLLPCVALGLNNGLGRTPQMGWNSWNHFRCNINEAIIRNTADALISWGLYQAGYKYVNIDDCWAKSRDSVGIIQPDDTTFPNFTGMIDYVHSKGLLFGLYSDAGNMTCAGRPGSLGYETIDAITYALWGVDYLKYDNCHSDGIPPEKRYPVMRDALNKTGRPIFYSLCEWGVDDPATWAPEVGNSWRTTQDISDNWDSMINRADLNNMWWFYAGPGGWNDPDMLETANGGMTITEYRVHFSLWCLMKAPLLIGGDLEQMNVEVLKILTNEEVIAVNQDPLGIQGHKVLVDGESEIWAGPLSDNSFAVILLNRAYLPTNITLSWQNFGLDPTIKANVRDLWLKEDLGTMVGGFTKFVDSHGLRMYRITPV